MSVVILKIPLGVELKHLVKLEHGSGDVIKRKLLDREGNVVGEVASYMVWDKEVVLTFYVVPQFISSIMKGCKIEGGRRFGITPAGRIRPFKKKKKK